MYPSSQTARINPPLSTAIPKIQPIYLMVFATLAIPGVCFTIVVPSFDDLYTQYTNMFDCLYPLVN